MSDGGGRLERFGPYWDNTNSVIYTGIYVYAFVAGAYTVAKNFWTDEDKSTTVTSRQEPGTVGEVTGYFEGTYNIEIRASDDSTVIAQYPNYNLSRQLDGVMKNATSSHSITSLTQWMLEILKDGSDNFSKLTVDDGSAILTLLQMNAAGTAHIFNDIITKGPWVDIRAFGAIGDGITDDTVAIQSAVDNGTAYIFIPEGTYNITSDITVSSSIVMFGVSKEVSIITGTGALYLEASSEFRDIGFEGTSSHIQLATDSGSPTSYDYLRVYDCSFANCTTTSIITENVNRDVFITEISISRCKFDGGGAGTGAIDMRCGHETANIHKNNIKDYNSGGGCGAIRLGQLTTSTAEGSSIITKNYIDTISATGGSGSTYGIQIIKGQYNIANNVIKNLINDDKDDCEGIYGGGLGGTITGNSLIDAGAGEAQIVAKSGAKITITSNYIYQTSGRNRAPGISIQSSQGGVCSGNIIINPYKRGIYLAGGSDPADCTISDNVILDVENDGTGFAFSDYTCGIYVSSTGANIRIINNIVNSVIDSVSSTNTTGVFATGGQDSLYIHDNILDTTTYGVVISASPTHVSIKNNEIKNATTGLLGTTTGGIDDLVLVGNNFDVSGSGLVFSGDNLPDIWVAYGNKGCLEGSATTGIGPISHGSSGTHNISVRYAEIGDYVKIFPPDLLGQLISGFVSTSGPSGVAIVCIGNLTGSSKTIPSSDWVVSVEKKKG